VRLGYVFHMTPAPEPTGKYDLLDCHRHALTLGGGVELGDGKAGQRPLSLDLALQIHILQDRQAQRTDPEIELAELAFGGVIVDAAFTLAWRF